MHLENLKQELETRGIDSAEVTIMKNGIECRGIRVIKPGEAAVCPVVYYSEEESMEEFVSRVEQIIKADCPKIDTSVVTDRDYVMDHVYIGIQRPCAGDYLTRDYLDLQLYMYVTLDVGEGEGSYKVTPSLINVTGVDEDEIWNRAIHNSHRYSIRSMGELIGIGEDDTMYVGISNSPVSGASILCNAEAFKQFCDAKEESGCFILPSSTQEVIVLPTSVTGRMQVSPSELAGMVDQINGSLVDPTIQLLPTVYYYDLDDNEIRIAETF